MPFRGQWPLPRWRREAQATAQGPAASPHSPRSQGTGRLQTRCERPGGHGTARPARGRPTVALLETRRLSLAQERAQIQDIITYPRDAEPLPETAPLDVSADAFRVPLGGHTSYATKAEETAAVADDSPLLDDKYLPILCICHKERLVHRCVPRRQRGVRGDERLGVPPRKHRRLASAPAQARPVWRYEGVLEPHPGGGEDVRAQDRHILCYAPARSSCGRCSRDRR